MSRLSIETPGKAETVIAGLYRDIERRISASPPGLSVLRLCHAQTCGKCVPCRIGLGQRTTLLEQVLDSTATPETIDLIEKTARVIQDTAYCAIGYEAARMVLQGVQGFRDDYLSHVESGRCLFGWDHPVPCVALCPAGVDIPGYIALVRAGRYNDAVRLIRKDNPFPTVCGYVCEHPCEAHCRRSMVDDAVNICGIKRFACDHADNTTPPDSAPSTGKRIGIIGGSAGGYLTAMAATTSGTKTFDKGDNLQVGSDVKAAVDLYGLSDLTRIGDDYNDSVKKAHRSAGATEALWVNGSAVFGGHDGGILANPEGAQKANPITYISQTSAPLLLMHGTNDTVVSPSQTDLLFQALQKHHVPSKRYLVEGAAHGGIYWNQKEVLDIITTFFDSYLKK